MRGKYRPYGIQANNGALSVLLVVLDIATVVLSTMYHYHRAFLISCVLVLFLLADGLWLVVVWSGQLMFGFKKTHLT